MSAERDHILKMVESGSVSAAEAAELLAVLAEDQDTARLTRGELPGAPDNPPWEAPFVAGIVVTGFGLLSLMRSRRGNIFSRLSAWITLFLGIGATLVGFWSRNTPWLHIRVQERDGHKVRISLPLLLPMARTMLDLARGFVDAATEQQLDSAAAFIDSLQRGEQPEPVSIEIEDGDGGQVYVYIA